MSKTRIFMLICGLVIIAGVAEGLPQVVGNVIQLHNVADASVPAAATQNKGGLLFGTTSTAPLVSTGAAWLNVLICTLSGGTCTIPAMNITATGNVLATNIAGTTAGTNTGDVTLGTPGGLSIVGQVLSFSGTASTTTTWRQYGKRINHCAPVNAGSTNWGCNGPTVPTWSGTTVSAITTNATRSYTSVATSTSSGNTAGVNVLSTSMFSKWAPSFFNLTLTDATITNERVWIGMTEAALATLAIRAGVGAGTAASVIDFAACGYDTAVDPNWQCCSGDGTNYGCIDSGIPVVVSTQYSVYVDWTNPATLSFTINGTTVSKSSNVSVTDVTIFPTAIITTNTTAAAAQLWAQWETTQN